MGFNPQTETPSSPSHLYSQELQLKLYQAFIFSIPILFSIILFLLFYLFYLKKRVSSINSSNSANRPPQNSDRLAATVSSSSADGLDLEEICKEKLPVILYDENSKSRETRCCVCLGEFEVKEELHQIPSCKHLFHIDCISHWLHSNSTCPLCRSPVLMSTTTSTTNAATTSPHEPNPSAGNDQALNQIPGLRMVHAEQPQQLTEVVLRVEVCASEGSSSRNDSSDESLVIISIQS